MPDLLSWGSLLALGAMLVLSSAAWALFSWFRPSGLPPSERRQAFGVSDALQGQLLALAPVLLQLVQLWAVLSALSRPSQEHESDEESSRFADTFWEMHYVKVVQLTFTGFQDSLRLQCRFSQRTALLLEALVSPVMPLALLLGCVVIELAKPTSGISAALKVLTFFFIGGASSCADLWSCQRVDGGGQSLAEEQFRLILPYLGCDDPDALVDGVAWVTGVAYALLIPAFLGHLYLRQLLVLKTGRSWTPAVAGCEAERIIRLQPLDVAGQSGLTTLSEQGYQQRLAACAAAYASVMLSGPVRVELRDQTMILTALNGSRSSESADFDVVGLVGTQAQAAEQKVTAYRRITKMLIQRCVLKELEGTERSLTGAKEVLAKYALSGRIWMEAVLKLVSVALVAVVSNESGLKLSVAITALMAASIALTQPYVQKQVTVLQCSCFLCLSLAAVGFHEHWLGLSRAALMLPFLLASALLLHPDSPATLAPRLFEEICSHLDDLQRGKVIQMTVELANLL